MSAYGAGSAMPASPAVRVPVGKVDGRVRWREDDVVAVEEPLEIRVGSKSLSVTMRTPGHDLELAAGFLFAEGIIENPGQIRAIANSELNVVEVDLSDDAPNPGAAPQRGFVMTSACGVCGKESLEALAASRCAILPPSELRVDAAVLHSLPDELRRRQNVFDSTGGLHAAALFSPKGELESLREDVGRHNAVDKVVGRALLDSRIPLGDSIMLVSGRASFELVQKATMAGVSVLAAVGAPSSFAVAEAVRCHLTLIGFLRNGSFNVYNGIGSITGLEPG